MSRKHSRAKRWARAPSPLDGNVAEALRHHQAGRLAEAERGYRGVLAIDPFHVNALHSLGIVASQHGDNAEALRHFRQALALKPDFEAAARNIAHALLMLGRPEEAVNASADALAIGETPEAKLLFVQALSLSQDAARIAPSRAMIVRALTERWARPADLARIAAQVLVVSGTLAKETRHPDLLLLALLTAGPVCTLELERHLTSLRRRLLQRACASDRTDGAMLALCCALARQCFINEYVFAHDPDEIAQAHRLRAKLASGETPMPVQLAVVAAYFPLHAIEGAAALLTRAWPEPIKPLLALQIAEPLEERDLRSKIPRLTAISGEVSRAVQSQYEDNPYPRWIESTNATTAAPGQAFDALVAGCGTGRQSVELAQRFPYARVLAVDLSLTSLAYALRRTRALGITSITYAQADIMALGETGRTFELIEANGVLHHLADPWAGWRVLLGLLRPGGRMRVGLYSQLARQPVVAAHAFIAQRGYRATAEDIRRFRQDVLAEQSLAMLPQSRDFYTVSGCRDLLFHVQEHRTTLPQIKAFVAENGLTFEGFELDAASLRAFRRRFPGDRDATNLDHWDTFEQDNPHTFVRMYQFSVKKA